MSVRPDDDASEQTAYNTPVNPSTSEAGRPWPGRVRLMREIRFTIDRDWVRAAHGDSGFEGALPVTNSWGGWPSAVGIAPYLVLRITVSGTPDPVTGYLINIQSLDAVMRRYAIPAAAQRLFDHGVCLTGEQLVREVYQAVGAQFLQVATDLTDIKLEQLELFTTPFLSYAIDTGAEAMIELTQCFEFSASHRLHVDSLSDEENRRVFGKCNNLNGHGHNYQVQITVCGEVSKQTGSVMALPELERIVKRVVIDRFDHRHLNTDTTDFRDLNPSVENIARRIWELLCDEVSPTRLRRVRVWETAKTFAEYTDA